MLPFTLQIQSISIKGTVCKNYEDLVACSGEDCRLQLAKTSPE